MPAREITFLGTASQVPTRHRNHNGIFVRWDTLGLLIERFDITAASEVMAILCLARDYADLKARLEKLLAEDLVAAARARGMAPTMRSLDEAVIDELPSAERVLVITSTYGDGELPDNAGLFWDDFGSEAAPRLEDVRFAVLALGDTAYDDFCQAGKLVDLRFEQLGATRLLPRVDCDTDYDAPAAAWIEQVLDLLAAEAPSAGAVPAAASVA